MCLYSFFFFNDTATTEIYTLSLHDALPILAMRPGRGDSIADASWRARCDQIFIDLRGYLMGKSGSTEPDRKSTRLNSSHSQISYAVFCLKKKKKNHTPQPHSTQLSVCATTP